MIDVNVTLERKLQQFFHLGAKKVGWATADAMNNAGKDAAEHLKRVAPRYIDRPAPFTLRGISRFPFYVKPASLEQWVGFRKKADAEQHYLSPMTQGGKRLPKKSEQKLAGKGLGGSFITPRDKAPLKLNRYGNVTRAGISKALKGDSGGKFFALKASGRRKTAGVYARVGRRKIRRVLNLVQETPRYEQSFPVGEILQDRYLQRLPAALTLYLRRKL